MFHCVAAVGESDHVIDQTIGLPLLLIGAINGILINVFFYIFTYLLSMTYETFDVNRSGCIKHSKRRLTVVDDIDNALT